MRRFRAQAIELLEIGVPVDEQLAMQFPQRAESNLARHEDLDHVVPD